MGVSASASVSPSLSASSSLSPSKSASASISPSASVSPTASLSPAEAIQTVLVDADVVIEPGDLLCKAPGESRLYGVNWDDQLPATVTIDESTFTITALHGVTDDVLTQAHDDIADDGRSTQVMLAAGSLGEMYEITNAIVTNETPAQTLSRSFRVLIETL